MEIVLLTDVDGSDPVAAFLRGHRQSGSEITGPAFSPDGTRLYFARSAARPEQPGITYEITGPFRTRWPAPHDRDGAGQRGRLRARWHLRRHQLRHGDHAPDLPDGDGRLEPHRVPPARHDERHRRHRVGRPAPLVPRHHDHRHHRPGARRRRTLGRVRGHLGDAYRPSVPSSAPTPSPTPSTAGGRSTSLRT